MAYIDQFLQIVVRQGASDLHIAEGQPPKMRTHGDIMPMRDEPMSREEATRMLSEVCGSQNWEIFEQHGDLDFAYQMDQHSRFRTNYFKQSNGYGAAFRLIPTKISTLEELGVPVIVKEFAYLRGGLLLVTGPTGSGKTTTQAALIDFINQNFSKHVVTIEEPIEFVPCRTQSSAASGHRYRADRRDARLGNDLARPHRLRDRPSGHRHVAHQQCAQDGRSHDR